MWLLVTDDCFCCVGTFNLVLIVEDCYAYKDTLIDYYPCTQQRWIVVSLNKQNSCLSMLYLAHYDNSCTWHILTVVIVVVDHFKFLQFLKSKSSKRFISEKYTCFIESVKYFVYNPKGCLWNSSKYHTHTLKDYTTLKSYDVLDLKLHKHFCWQRPAKPTPGLGHA